MVAKIDAGARVINLKQAIDYPITGETLKVVVQHTTIAARQQFKQTDTAEESTPTADE